MKKFFAVILALALCLTAFCGMSAMAEEGVTYVQVTDLEEVKKGGDYAIVAYHAPDDAYYAMYTFSYTTKIDSTKVLPDVALSVTDGMLTITGGDMPVWTIAADGETISMYQAGGGYIGWQSGANIEWSETACPWNIVAGENGTFRITIGDGAQIMGYRDNNPYFRFAPWGAAKEGDPNYTFDLMLFKAVAPETPNGPEGPGIDDTADINTMPLYAVLVLGVAVVAFASKKRFAK